MTDNALSLAALANELEVFIQGVVPDAERISKYGGTLFTVKPEEKEGQFCGVFAQKHHVQLSFSKGVELEDPKSLLEGSGKLRRHINYSSLDDVSFEDLEALVIQSAEL